MYRDWHDLAMTRSCRYFITVPLEAPEGVVGSLTVASIAEPAPDALGVLWLGNILGVSLADRKSKRELQVKCTY